MIRFTWKLIKALIVTPLVLVGIGTSAWYGSHYYPVFSLLDGRTILRVVEVEKIGDVYTAKKYTLTENGRLYIARLQGLDIDSLVEVGTLRHLSISEADREVLIDIAQMVQPKEDRYENEDSYLSLCLAGDNFFTINPRHQPSASTLIRSLARFSKNEEP